MTIAIAIKDRPILMHARSIRGILEGRKTQTRRIIKTKHSLADLSDPSTRNIRVVTNGGIQFDYLGGVASIPQLCPYGYPGDQLWVREAWLPRNSGTLYKADYEDVDAAGVAGMYSPTGKWKPSMFMPRWACRLILEIKSIRVERVRDISARDALAEGVQVPVSAPNRPLLCISRTVDSHKLWRDHKNATDEDWLTGYFALLWEETNGKGAWDRNDWCWVIEFKVAR